MGISKAKGCVGQNKLGHKRRVVVLTEMEISRGTNLRVIANYQSSKY